MATATAILIDPDITFSYNSQSESFSDLWQVTTDVCTFNKNTIRSATNLPQIGDYYKDEDGTEDELVIVDNCKCDRSEESNLVWHVTVNYKTRENNFEGTIGGGGVSRLLGLNIGSVAYQETVDYCYQAETITSLEIPSVPNWDALTFGYDSVPTTNTAGDLITGITVSRFNKQINMTQAEEVGFDVDVAQSFIGSTNKKDIRVAGVNIKANEGLMTSLSSSLQNPSESSSSYPDGKYWQTTYEIQVQTNGWYTKVLNNGFNQLKTIDSVKTLVKIKYGDLGAKSTEPDDAVSEAQKLNIDGSVIPTSSTDAYYKVFWNVFPQDWGSVIEFVKER